MSSSPFTRNFYSYRAPLVAQSVKNPPAMWETWIQSLGQEDSLEKEMATHYNILARKIQWTEESGRLTVHGVAWGRKESDTTK